MFNTDSSKVRYVEVATNALNQALQNLQEHDYTSAQVMVVAARQVLEDLQSDVDRHFQVETMLTQILNPSLK
jgi:hypothetical protein